MMKRIGVILLCCIAATVGLVVGIIRELRKR